MADKDNKAPQGDDNQNKFSKREADAAAKAAAYKLEQEALAAKAREETEADAKAKREAELNDPIDPNLVKMAKDGEVLAVHVSTVGDHQALGWRIV